jgi:hypothetical protein
MAANQRLRRAIIQENAVSVGCPTLEMSAMPEAIFMAANRRRRRAIMNENNGLPGRLQRRHRIFMAANQRLWRAIMNENCVGGAGRFIGASRWAIVLRLTKLRWLTTPIGSPARAA